MQSKLFDRATLLRDEGAKTRSLLTRKGSLDPLSEAHALVSNTGEPSSVRFLRAFRFLFFNDPNALATALASNSLTPTELDLLVTASCVLTSGATSPDNFAFILGSNEVSPSRISLIAKAQAEFDFMRILRDVSVSDGILSLCDGETSDLFNALTSVGFAKRIDRILVVASAIERFDETLGRYDGFPFPITTGGIPFPEFFARTYASLASRIAEYAKAGIIPFESDLLDLLMSRFDPDSILSSKPSRIPKDPLPTYFPPPDLLLDYRLVGYRGIEFDDASSRPTYAAFVALCTCLALSHPMGIPNAPEIARTLIRSTPDPQKRDD